MNRSDKWFIGMSDKGGGWSMEIAASGQVVFYEGAFENELRLKVEFKLPNRIFKTKITRVISSDLSEEYDTYEQFLNEAIQLTSDGEILIGMVEEVVKNHIEDIEYSHDLKDKEKILNKKLAEMGKIEVKVKIGN